MKKKIIIIIFAILVFMLISGFVAEGFERGIKDKRTTPTMEDVSTPVPEVISTQIWGYPVETYEPLPGYPAWGYPVETYEPLPGYPAWGYPYPPGEGDSYCNPELWWFCPNP